MADVLKPGGYYDTPMWGHMTTDEGETVRVMVLPITRYDNILGRPRLITDMEKAIPTDISLLKAGEREVSDAIIFQKADQSW
jgi:hypothetical protein